MLTRYGDIIRNRNLKLLAIVTGICLIVPAPRTEAEPAVDGFFTAAQRAAVKKGVIITRASVKNGDRFNIPERMSVTLPLSPHIPRALADFEILAEERAFMPFDYTGPRKLSFYNGLFAFSRFTGMRYYSRTDKKMLTCILDSGRISAPGGQVLADPVYTSAEPRREGYFRVRDNRFGDIVFANAVLNRGGSFIINSACTHPLTRMGITIAEKEEYRMISVFIHNPADRGFYYYGLHALRVRSGFFISSGLLNADSFANRIRAETVRRASLLGLDWSAKIRP
jgi:hypothetical protein